MPNVKGVHNMKLIEFIPESYVISVSKPELKHIKDTLELLLPVTRPFYDEICKLLEESPA